VPHPSLPYNGHRNYFLCVKLPENEVDHSPPSSAEVKNEWICASTPLYAFMAWTGITLPSRSPISEDVKVRGCRQATDRLQTGYRQAADRLQTGYRQATDRLQTGYRQAIDRLQTGYRQATDRLQTGYRQATDRLQTGCRQATDRLQTGYRQEL